jgi:hypothetical protein
MKFSYENWPRKIKKTYYELGPSEKGVGKVGGRAEFNGTTPN